MGKEVEMTNEKETEKLDTTTINNDTDFINKLADLPTGNKEADFSILKNDSKEEIENKQEEIIQFLEDNDPNKVDPENKDELFLQAINKWDEMKDIIKNAVCTVKFTNVELKVLDNKLHKNAEYNAETIFYAMHLKKHFLNMLPKTSGGAYVSHDIDITFSQSVGLYHIISDIKVKGLSESTYAFANILYTLSEITHVYNYFDRVSAFTSKKIKEWNKGLTLNKNEKEAKEVAEENKKNKK